MSRALADKVVVTTVRDFNQVPLPATQVAPLDPQVFGYPADDVTAVATVVLAGATVLLAIATFALFLVAGRQLPLLVKQVQTEQERDARRLVDDTLAICRGYAADPLVSTAARRVWDWSNGGLQYEYDVVIEQDLITTLNYLDTIAVGVQQGFYLEPIVQANVGSTIVKAVDQIIPAFFKSHSGYEALLQLRNRWR